MENPTFEQQYQKIVNAYYKNELDPWNCKACFVGNLLNNKNGWENARDIYACKVQNGSPWELSKCRKIVKDESNDFYTYEEIVIIENNFLRKCYVHNGFVFDKNTLTEESLFNAMESTLLMLKKLHESKGEIIQDYNFTKRENKSLINVAF